MKVLFVDDEPKVLEGLERTLFHLTGEWDMTFTSGGREAVAELERGPFEVIVTDMRMPEMDGAELLKVVQRRWPETVRIVLSGYSEMESALRSIPVAHQFLSKPCQPEILEDAVIRSRGLQALLGDRALRAVVGQVEKLPSVPSVYAELTRVLGDEDVDVNDVARIVERDPAMCAKVLQLVNSAFFSRGARCADIRQAVMRLGLQMIKGLVLTVEVFRIPRGGKKVHGFSIDELQDHAIRTAAVAHGMFGDKSLADDAFTAGLLHDIGRLITVVALPVQMTEALARSRDEDRPFHEVEREVMGTTHAELGAYLLGIWGLPYPIVEAVANHHDPGRVDNRTGFGVLEAVHVADLLTRGGSPDPAFVEAHGIGDRLESWQELAAER